MENTYLQDLQLDNPDAAHLLSLFLGRAIVDEALPPSFLAAVLPTLEDHSEGVNVVQSTGTDALRMYVASYCPLRLDSLRAMLKLFSSYSVVLQVLCGILCCKCYAVSVTL